MGQITDSELSRFAPRLKFQLSGVAGEPYEVTEKNVANAVRVEGLLVPLSERVLPPIDDERCFRGS